ncbi:hypothetical protein SUGI_0131290 [Cryptomeria japonica]|nr:hypothetical protein SUGI_0131290 [Cryptomeria japonica]
MPLNGTQNYSNEETGNASVLGMLFRQMNICVPVDPLEWQISQETANKVAACMANTVGATESVLRVAASGHDKKLFLKVAVVLYLLSVLGRAASGATVAYAALWIISLIFCSSKLSPDATRQPQYLNRKRDGTKTGGQEN